MTDRHEHLDEGTIHAWLDGGLPPDESARVESRAQSCAECAALVAEARGLIAASSRILSSLDAVPAGVIPGSSANVDQLAALRARRRASTRRWWQDRRIVTAASVVFVAGVSSLVWRSSTSEPVRQRAELAVDSASPAADQPQVTADAPATTAPAVTREATTSDAKAAPPTADLSRARAASARLTDSATAQKAVSANTPARVGSAVAANEAKRADQQILDSARVMRSEQRAAAAEQQLRQQSAISERQPVQQFRVDPAARSPAPPAAVPAPLNAGLRRSPALAAGAAMRDAMSLAQNCYRLRLVPRSPGESARAVADTVKLLNETAPALSDPSWFRTQTFGGVRDTTLAWRAVDSVTVEVRAHFGSDTTAVRFRTDGGVPDSRSLPGIRPAFAARVGCPN